MNHLLLPGFAVMLLLMPVLAQVQGRPFGGIATTVVVISGVLLLLISAVLTTVRRLYQKTKASEAFVRTGFGGVRVADCGVWAFARLRSYALLSEICSFSVQ